MLSDLQGGSVDWEASVSPLRSFFCCSFNAFCLRRSRNRLFPRLAAINVAFEASLERCCETKFIKSSCWDWCSPSPWDGLCATTGEVNHRSTAATEIWSSSFSMGVSLVASSILRGDSAGRTIFNTQSSSMCVLPRHTTSRRETVTIQVYCDDTTIFTDFWLPSYINGWPKSTRIKMLQRST